MDNFISEMHRFVMPVPNSGCWIWMGALCGYDPDSGYHRKVTRYGQTNIDGRSIKAHRASWMQHRGPIPEGMQVLHHCDVPTCVNPNHLFLGTHLDNMADMRAKGRRQGERASWPKLTEAQVIEIFNSPESHRALARRYGLSRATPAWIKQGRSWKHLRLRVCDEETEQ